MNNIIYNDVIANVDQTVEKYLVSLSQNDKRLNKANKSPNKNETWIQAYKVYWHVGCHAESNI